MVSFSEHRRWIISVFDRRSIMNRLYWHDQQVGYVCFIPFVWEQRGVIAAVADQTAMISHLLPMCWATRGRSWGHVMMWARFGSQGSIALNWHSRYSGTRYSGTWLYLIFQTISVIDGWVISCELALRWMSLDLTDDKSTLVQIMAWCRHATSHYLSQCWPRSMSPYDVTRPQWVNSLAPCSSNFQNIILKLIMLYSNVKN